ncbi:MAG: hypothetical protein H6729_04945 [Deltaproteobacteria bacterium]|nr:hypothetical protein [Deltaproteobacteria bacterium]
MAILTKRAFALAVALGPAPRSAQVPASMRVLTGVLTRALTLSLVLAACVAEMPLDSAPCPCGANYVCCKTTGVCLSPSDVCPAVIPPSTADHCRMDTDCGHGEFCASWQISSTSSREGECRRDCASGAPCSSGEACRLSLHDNSTPDALKIATLCLPSAPAAGCDAWTCDCDDISPGGTACRDRDLVGCQIVTHPTCGLGCGPRVIAGCEGVETVPVCMPCEACGGAGATYCSGDDLSGCALTVLPDGSECCDTRRIVSCASGCENEGALAHCSP